MHSLSHPTFKSSLTLFMGVALLTSLPIQAGELRQQPQIAQVGESVTLPTQAGHAYQLEWRHGAGDWNLGSAPVFADSETLTLKCPPGVQAATCEFRLAEIPNTVGPAPTSVAKKQFTMVDSVGGAISCLFLNGSTAVVKRNGHPFAIRYTTKKTSPTTLVLEFTLNGTAEEWTMEFSTEKGGLATIVSTNAEGITDSYEHPFAYGKPPAVKFHNPIPTLPGDVEGLTLGISEHGHHQEMSFANGMLSFSSEGGGSAPVPYVYELEANNRATISYTKNGRANTYEVELNTPTTGIFVHHGGGGYPSGGGGGGNVNPPPNNPTPVSGGVITPPPPANNTPVSGAKCEAPPSLNNVKLKMSPETSVLSTFTFGVDTGNYLKNDDGSAEFTPFEYSYERIDSQNGHATATYPSAAGNRVDEIDLDFSGEEDCAGTYTRTSYLNGNPIGTSTGTFGPG